MNINTNNIAITEDAEKLSNNFHKMMVKMSFYTRFLELAVKNYEPYFFANYLIQLATEFHALWEKEKFIDDKNENSTIAKLSIIKGVQALIKNGLNIFKIETITQM